MDCGFLAYECFATYPDETTSFNDLPLSIRLLRHTEQRANRPERLLAARACVRVWSRDTDGRTCLVRGGFVFVSPPRCSAKTCDDHQDLHRRRPQAGSRPDPPATPSSKRVSSFGIENFYTREIV